MKLKINPDLTITIPPTVMSILKWNANDKIDLDIVVNRNGSVSHIVIAKDG